MCGLQGHISVSWPDSERPSVCRDLDSVDSLNSLDSELLMHAHGARLLSLFRPSIRPSAYTELMSARIALILSPPDLTGDGRAL